MFVFEWVYWGLASRSDSKQERWVSGYNWMLFYWGNDRSDYHQKISVKSIPLRAGDSLPIPEHWSFPQPHHSINPEEVRERWSRRATDHRVEPILVPKRVPESEMRRSKVKSPYHKINLTAHEKSWECNAIPLHINCQVRWSPNVPLRTNIVRISKSCYRLRRELFSLCKLTAVRFESEHERFRRYSRGIESSFFKKKLYSRLG